MSKDNTESKYPLSNNSVYIYIYIYIYTFLNEDIGRPVIDL